MTTVFYKPTATPAAASGVQEAADRVNQAAGQQMKWNRPNTANPWASQTSNPDGSVSLGFSGPLGGAQQNLMAQALRTMGQPTDFNQFNVGTGDDFRQKGIDSAQGQMSDWLNPLQGGFDSAEKQRLLNAGYAEGSPEFQAQMSKGAGTAADLQSSIGNAAIGLGGEMGAKMGAMDMLAKQQGLAEALRKRTLPMEQLGAMQGLLEQPGYSPDGSIMAGATADFDHYLNSYLGKRQDYEAQNAEDQQAGLSAGLQAFQTAGTLGMSSLGGLGSNSKPVGGHPYGRGPLRSI